MRASIFFLILAIIFGCKMTKKQNADKASTSKDPQTERVSLCGPTPADLNTKPGKNGRLVPLFEAGLLSSPSATP